MKKFEENFSTGQPSLRIGSRVPAGAVNLTFFDSPVITPYNTIQLFDRSKHIPENTEVVEVQQSDLFTNSDGMLVSDKGSAIFPVKNVVVTNKYIQHGDGADYTPLFYVSRTRFRHYEPGLNKNGTFEYTGQNIVVLDGEVPTDKAYRVMLTSTGITNVYHVEIYSEFAPTEDQIFYIQYNKRAANNTTAGYREIMNAYPIFTETNKGSLGENNYYVEKTPDDDGFMFYVGAKSNKQNKTPIIFKWRVVRNGSEYTPWFVSSIHNKQALQRSEYVDASGRTAYIDHQGKAAKPLGVPSRYFGNRSGLYTVEIESLTGSTNAVKLIEEGPYSGDTMVYAYTDENTGMADDDNNVFSMEYPLKVFNYTVKAKSTYKTYTSIPGSIKNVSKQFYGATATTDASSLGYRIYKGPEHAIDGTSLSILNSFNFINIPTNRFEVVSDEMANPPTSNVTLSIDLNANRQIDDLEVVMGSKGNLVKVDLLDDSDQVLASIPASSFTKTTSTSAKRFTYKLGTPMTGVRKMNVVASPDKWITRDYIFFLNWFGFKDMYKSGLQIVEVNAFERIPPSTSTEIGEWENEITITDGVSASLPYTRSFQEILERYPELVPPNENQMQETVYTIINENEKDGVSLVLKRPDGSLVNNNNGQMTLTYPDAIANEYLVSATTDLYDVLVSYRYSIRTEESQGIFIYEPGHADRTDMWGLEINNGSMFVRDFNANIKKEYYIPEYGTQAFDPQQPYMRSEEEVAIFVDNKVVRVANKNLHVEIDSNGNPTNLVVTRNNVPVSVRDWNKSRGEIYLEEDVDITDHVRVSYSYISNKYIYRGFGDSYTQKFYYLDLNPMPGHTYTDLDTGEEKPSVELLDKVVYIYIVPSYINDKGVVSGANFATVRHDIFPEDVPESEAWQEILSSEPHALLLGKIMVRNRHISRNVVLMDSRRRGGGLSDKLSIESIDKMIGEGDAVWDVSPWDGHPYPSTGVGVITLPKSILVENGGKYTEDQVREVINRYMAFGVYAIIRYK